jgi:hypothetical protein
MHMFCAGSLKYGLVQSRIVLIFIFFKSFTFDLFFNRYTLIHNINFWAPFPIDQDGYLSPTFQVPILFNIFFFLRVTMFFMVMS